MEFIMLILILANKTFDFALAVVACLQVSICDDVLSTVMWRLAPGASSIQEFIARWRVARRTTVG